jgi:RNA polymerase sigma-70 factor (ECF subfamily)
VQCLTDAWNAHEAELRGFLRHRTRDDAVADDLLQEVFLRALRRQSGLCGIDNPRVRLFQVARCPTQGCGALGRYYAPALLEQDVDDVTAYLNRDFYKF